MKELPTYTVPDNVYESFFYGSTLGLGKGPLSTPRNLQPDVGAAPTSVPGVTPIPIDIGFATLVAVASTTVTLDQTWLNRNPAFVFGDIDESRSTSTSLSSDVQNIPIYPTLVPQQSYTTTTTVGRSSNEGSISPIAIVGLAIGGTIAIVVALVMIVLMYSRRNHSGRYRQNSVAGPESPMGMVAIPCKTEVSVSKESVSIPQELPPSSLRQSPRPSNKNRYNKHITWKDQVFSNQSFTGISPLPPHPTSLVLPSLPRDCLRIGQGVQDPISPDYTLQLLNKPDNRVSYRSFSSPTLGGDCTSIYSSIPPSPMYTPTLSPLPSYLFPAHQLQKSLVPAPQYNPIISSNGLNDRYATITCTSVYSFLPGSSGRRSRPDSFTIQGGNSPNHIHGPSMRCSSNPPNFRSTFSYPKLSAPLLPQPSSHKSKIQGSQSRFSSYIVTEGLENNGDSISSVSSTSSSILDYSVSSTPQKLLTGGILRVGSSSPRSYEDSPPSGGLTSPFHRKKYHQDLTIRTLHTISKDIFDGPDSRKAPGTKIEVALSPLLSRTASITSSSSSTSEGVFHDLFFDTQDINTHSSVVGEISTRHFSCSMPTLSKPVTPNTLPPSYPKVIPSSARSNSTPQISGCTSTLVKNPFEPRTQIRASEHDDFGVTPMNPLRRMRSGAESTYSPTLSMVNFYMVDNNLDSPLLSANHVDSPLSPINFFTPFSPNIFPSSCRLRSSSVPSSVVNHQDLTQDHGLRRELVTEEYLLKLPKKRLHSLPIAPNFVGAG